MADRPLWSPSPERVAGAGVTAFMKQLNRRPGVSLATYAQLHDWSVAHLEEFWSAVWEFGGVIGTPGGRVLVDGDKMPGARFFPDGKLNFAENLLRKKDDGDALVFWGEDRVKRRLSRRELHDFVSRVQQALAKAGVKEGDRVAAFMPNMPETVIAMLATTSLGAAFTSASPDFGVQGVVDRFGQVEPTVLFACDGYYYNGKVVGTLERIAEIVKQLPTVKKVVVVPYVSANPDAGKIDRAVTLATFLAPFAAKRVAYTRVPFNHPLYILYSSGTTGVPKCIVHGAGGVLNASTPRPWKLYGDVRGLNAPPRRIVAPAAATASAVSKSCSRLSTEHGPAIIVSEPSPTTASRTRITVSSGWNSRDVSLNGRLIGVTVSTPGRPPSRLMRAGLRAPISPMTAITVRSAPVWSYGVRPSPRMALFTPRTSASPADRAITTNIPSGSS